MHLFLAHSRSGDHCKHTVLCCHTGSPAPWSAGEVVGRDWRGVGEQVLCHCWGLGETTVHRAGKDICGQCGSGTWESGMDGMSQPAKAYKFDYRQSGLTTSTWDPNSVVETVHECSRCECIWYWYLFLCMFMDMLRDINSAHIYTWHYHTHGAYTNIVYPQCAQVIEETLRTHCPVRGPFKESPVGGINLSGCDIPGGTMILVSMHCWTFCMAACMPLVREIVSEHCWVCCKCALMYVACSRTVHTLVHGCVCV